jgi:UDP-GlcNAc:undecaprenyl-phosphate GlcNAc-1-phosphate transferase
MQAIIILGITALLLSLLLTPMCRDICLRFNLVDKPDAHRKFHANAVPRMGGVPIALSYGGALLLLIVFGPADTGLNIHHVHLLHTLLPAAAIIFFTGLLDDFIGLKAWQKLSGQIGASFLAVMSGAHLAIFPTHPSVSFILSLIWLIACTNAVNLIDGMDGLATGVGIIAVLTTLSVAILSHNMGLAVATAPLAGCLLGFLRYNFAPASVFLGDCGSLTIGFMLGCFGLIWSSHSANQLGILGPLMALALPLLDVCVAIGRRYLRSVPIMQADRGHIHHMVQGHGLSTRNSALLLYAVCGICALLAVLTNFSSRGYGIPLFAAFCIVLIIFVNRLGYIEFRAARKSLSHRAVRSAVTREIYLHDLSTALLSATTLESWWTVTRNACAELHFASVQLDIDGHAFGEAVFDSSKTAMEALMVIHVSFDEETLEGKASRTSEKKLPSNASMRSRTTLREIRSVD